MQQRKRPIGGSAASSRATSRKKAKLVPSAKPAPLSVDGYAQLAKTALSSRVKPATTPSPAKPAPTVQRSFVPPTPPPASVAGHSAIELLVSSDEVDDELAGAESDTPPRPPSPAAPPAPPSTAVVPSSTQSAVTGRATASSGALHRLHFLLSSAHTLALTAPSISQRLIRLMRTVAVSQSIDLHADVQSRFCASCNAILLPGVNCTRRQKVDERRSELWRRKRQKTASKKQRHRASTASEASSASAPLTTLSTSTSHPSSNVSQLQKGKNLRLTAAQRKKARRARQLAEREGAVQPVRFYHTVVRCAHCGHEAEVEGSRVKRGGRHPHDLRVQSGDQLGSRMKRRSAPTSVASKPSTAVASTAVDAEMEEKRAAKRRQRLQRQQQLAAGQRSGAGSAGKDLSAVSSSTSDQFTGSLFFRFQRPGKQGVVPETRAAPAPSSAARPFSFTHPSGAAKPSSVPPPFVHSRAPAAAALTLLEAAARKKKDEERERKKREKLNPSATPPPPPPPPPPAMSNPSPPATLPAGGFYSLLQSFQR